jgi:amino acid transporter
MAHSSTTPNGDAATASGYQDTLERSTGRFASFAVAFAFVSIATGIFTTYGSVLKSSGPLGIWTWPIVIVGQLAVALLLGSLAARIPVTGYAYQWVSRLANPVLGWITGVILLLQGILVGVSTKWTERVNNFAVSAELIGMIALVVLLFIVDVAAHKLSVGNLLSRGGLPAEGYWSLDTATAAGPWMLGFLLGAFTIVGFESAANLAEETKRPETVVPKACGKPFSPRASSDSSSCSSSPQRSTTRPHWPSPAPRSPTSSVTFLVPLSGPRCWFSWRSRSSRVAWSS